MVLLQHKSYQVVNLLALAIGYNIFDILKIIVQKNNSVELLW
jgi:hypothetical protein